MINDRGLSAPSINRIPQGLLGFLGIKNGGAYPQALASALAPTLDLSWHYDNTNRLYRTNGVAVNALAQTNFVQVPIGEWWHVVQSSLFTGTLGAGQAYSGVLCMTDAAGLVTLMLGDHRPAVSGAGALYVAQARDFWLGPGDNLGVYTTNLAAGPISVGVSLAYAVYNG